MIIKAYKCLDTGKIFEKEEEYTTHRKELFQQFAKKLGKELLSYKEIVWDLNESSATFDDITSWVMQHQELLSMKHRSQFNNDGDDTVVITSIAWENIGFDRLCSNKNFAPRTGSTNWWRGGSRPMGYPGWEARLDIMFDGNLSIINDIFNSLKIWCGHSNRNGRLYQIDVTLFEDDWPGLKTFSSLSSD